MSRHNPTTAYVAPFVVYIALLSLQYAISLPTVVLRGVGFLIVLAVILAVSWPYVVLRPSHPAASIALGLAVFGIWIGPDLLFGYRHFWLFENALTGRAASTLAPPLRRDAFLIVIRMLTTAALVPVLEELFWRGWLMRWLVNSKNFLKVPMGTYQSTAFWLVAGLFASEHGPYWEVGLAAGILYNWWIIRTRNLADCILAHAVTNAALGTYVLMAGQWQYWL